MPLRAPAAGRALRWLLLVLAVAGLGRPAAALHAQACSVTHRQAVEALYLQVLEREADPGGLAYYTGDLGRGQTVRLIALGFAQSSEYHSRFIAPYDARTALTFLFRHLLARDPGAGEWGWTDVAATHGWNHVSRELVFSQEFTDRFGDRAVPGDPVVAWDCVRAGVALDPAHAAPVLERDLCLTVAAGSGAASECGDLRLAHALPTIRTLNKPRTPVLIYNQAHVDPHPVVGAYVSLPAGVAADSVSATLFGANGASLATGKWPAWAPGQERRIAVIFNARANGWETGVYAYTLQVRALSGGSAVAAYTVRGEMGLVNRNASPYGAGWWLAGVEELKILPDGRIMWVGGDGSYRVYRPLGGSPARWAAVHAADRPDTLYTTTHPYSAYERRLPGGTRVIYNGAGKHVATINRLNHQTNFGLGDGGRVAWIAVPRQPGYGASDIRYNFAYGSPGQRLSSVTSTDLHGNAARSTTIGIDGGGRLYRITDPDQRFVTFEFDAGWPWWMAARVDRRGTRTRYGFNGGKLVASSVEMQGTGADIHLSFANQETRGLAGAEPGDRIYTRLDGPRTDAADTTAFWLDRWGAPRRMVNAAGHETLLTRAHPQFRALVTRMRAPNGLETSAQYDARGNVLASTVHNPLGDGRDARTTYEWDARWDAPTRISTFEVAGGVVRELVGSTRMQYHPDNGNRLWQQQGDSVSRRVGFSYYPAGHPHAGQLSRVRTPSDVAHGVPGDSVAYDDWGNLREQVTTTGIRTWQANDGLGRPWVTVTPADPAKGLFRRDSVVYDAMDRVLWSIGTGPAMSNGTLNIVTGQEWSTPEERLFVRNTYDDGGSLTAVRRWSVPDTARVDTAITRFEYDRAGRKTAEIAADNARDGTEYDAAGNATAATTRRGYRITMTYDALNRLLTRTVPGTATHERFSTVVGGTTFTFPVWGTDASGNATVANGWVTLQADTERFGYDPSGNLVYAANRDAIVRRRYNPNGTLAGDTLVIAAYATRDTTQHVYGLRYQYDVMGRRTDLHHPSTLAPAGGWSVHNVYDPVTGALTDVADPVGTHHFAYNTAGQLTGEVYGNGVTDVFTHDAEGRLRTRTLTVPGTGVMDADTMTYDLRGKLSYVGQRTGNVRNFYSGLGTLAWSRWTDDGHGYTEQGYIQDALGNTARVERYDGIDSDQPKVEVTTHKYDARTMRLRERHGAPGLGFATTSIDALSYDAAGNGTYSSDNRLYGAIPNSRRVEGKASYYDAADRLRIVDMQACAWADSTVYSGGIATGTVMVCKSLRPGDRSAFEEYRYDALGRRVLVRTQERCEAGCIETVTRTVWDGDRVLWEIRAPGAYRERDVVPEGQLPAYNITTGRVAYTFGAALDHPLAVHRFDFRDSIFVQYDTVGVGLNFQPLTIYPQTNWRGDYQFGTYTTGEISRCAWVPQQTEDYEQYPSPGGDQPDTGTPTNPANGHKHCLAAVQWPGKYLWLDHAIRRAPPGNPDLWVGSLVKNKRDLTGNLYMRNRYYDAQAGRFTQEDPIGLAGGLNAYGFAAGDPVSYSDPYGLKPQDVIVACRSVDNTRGLGGHCSVRVINERMNVDVTYEVLAVNGIGGPQFAGQTSAEEAARYEGRGVQVDVPDGMTSDEFDLRVLQTAERLSQERNGLSYSPSGTRNSNRFVYDIIKQSGGKVPWAAVPYNKATPGICGGKGPLLGSDCSGNRSEGSSGPRR